MDTCEILTIFVHSKKIKQIRMATKYGKTWWGQQWLGALKNIDYSNRLSRGASYAKNGMVQEIIFNGNVIKAKVKGSRRTPYKETIVLPIFLIRR